MDRVANIGERERRRRLAFGAVMGASGVALVVALQVLDAPRAWRILTFLPFWAAALGFLQHKEKT